MNALAEQSIIHDVRIYPETQRHFAYVSPETDLH